MDISANILHAVQYYTTFGAFSHGVLAQFDKVSHLYKYCDHLTIVPKATIATTK